MNKKILLVTSSASLLCGAIFAADRSRPNILFVISDDQGWPHAGAYGSEWVNTPAFDGLAEDGVLFNNAFVSAPSSAPSRFSILTGRHFYQEDCMEDICLTNIRFLRIFSANQDIM